jgi:hypothetical protein
MFRLGCEIKKESENNTLELEASGGVEFYSIDTNSTANRATIDREAAAAELQ